jgi:hypothetical protein
MSEKQDQSGESVRFNDELNKEYHLIHLTMIKITIHNIGLEINCLYSYYCNLVLLSGLLTMNH